MHLNKSIEDRFWRLVEVIPFHSCWEWVGYINEHGYGKFTIKGKGSVKCLRAHRLSYELFIGPIPGGLDLDHLCRNRSCVNPHHLEPVTRKENLRRAPTSCVSGGITTAIQKRALTHCKSGHEFSPENTRITKSGWRQCVECSRKWRNNSYHRNKHVKPTITQGTR